MDVDLLTSADLVGLYSIDCSFVYYSRDHQINNKWLVLSAPHEEGSPTTSQSHLAAVIDKTLSWQSAATLVTIMSCTIVISIDYD